MVWTVDGCTAVTADGPSELHDDRHSALVTYAEARELGPGAATS